MNFIDDFTPTPALRRRAIFLLIVTAVLWSSSGLLIKMISWQSLSILSARSFISSLVLWAYLGHINLRWSRLQVVGALGYVGTNLFFVIATKLTTAANAIFLQYTSPLYLVVLGYWFLGERPRRADWGAMAAIFGGMLLFFGDDLSFDSISGNVFSIVSGVSMAIMILCLRLQKAGTPAQTILLGNVLAVLVGFPALLQETWSLTSVGIILYLGIFQLGLSFILYATAIKYIPALESTLIVTLEPILNPIWVFLVIGEMPGGFAVIGSVLVLGAVSIRAILSAQTPAEDLTPVGQT